MPTVKQPTPKRRLDCVKSLISNDNTTLVDASVTGSTLTLDYGADQNGAATIVVRATDSAGDFVEDTVDLTVNPVNDAPQAANASFTIDNDEVLNVTLPGVLNGATDVEGDPLSAVLVAGPSEGSLTLLADGSFTYTPNVAFAGVDQFSFVASDGGLTSGTATVTIVVNATAGPPDGDASDPDPDDESDAEDPGDDGDPIETVVEVVP